MEYLYETHMHTSEVSACAVSTGAQQAVAYKKRGYAGIIITDHFVNGYTTCPTKMPWEERMRYFVSGYDNTKAVGDMIGLDVFLGWEFTIRGSDFLTYGLDLEFLIAHPNVDRMEIEQYSALVRKNGGYIAQAHPYRDAYYIENKYPVDPHLLDGIEVFNSMDRDSINAKALAFANEHNLPMQAGTDSHSTGNRNGRGEQLRYSGIARQARAKTIHDIIDAIIAKDVKLI